MRTIRKKLSEEQVAEGIIFTSTLSRGRNEMSEDTTHEVYKTDEAKHIKIARLEDSSFFKNSPWSFNIIRTK